MTTLAELNGLDGAALEVAFARPPEDLVRLLRVAAEGGSVEAQLRLGQMLLDGQGGAASPVEALGCSARPPGRGIRWG